MTSTQEGIDLPADPVGKGTARGRTRWWRRPWIVPLALLVAAFLFISLPVYATLDRSQSRIALSDSFSLHYPFLVAHIAFGTIAMVTVVLQVWPWLRRRHPAVHRWSGRLYVFAGVIPSGLLALAITPFAVGPVGNAIGGILWLATTIAGYRMARQRRYADHRRWMIYSFALCLQIIEGRVMAISAPAFPGFTPEAMPTILETASWIGIFINLLIAQWWLDRTANARRRRAAVRDGQR
ncbi:DUF2306 domain-containing protein [Actinosynnema sp. CA-248983]